MTWSVILVEPENPGSIGFIARAMKNFGVEKLVLVNPCKITSMTRARAMHSFDVVENARVVKTFTEAINGFDEVIATSAKTSTDRNTTRAYLTPKELAQHRGQGNYALVFGRESRGLTSSEIRKCDLNIHIETPGYPVLNLTHSVAIVLYELFSSKSSTQRKSVGKEKQVVLQHFSDLAKQSGMRNPENAVKMFRNVVSRAFISGAEAHGIAGVLSRLKK